MNLNSPSKLLAFTVVDVISGGVFADEGFGIIVLGIKFTPLLIRIYKVSIMQLSTIIHVNRKCTDPSSRILLFIL
jgi:hypothetical protein